MTGLPIVLKVLALVLAASLCRSHGAEANRELSVQVVNVDKERDGPIDLKVQLRIATGARANISVECRHRTLGTGDWLMRVLAVESTNQELRSVVELVTELVADAVPLVEKALREDYAPHPLRLVLLPDERMPDAFTARIHGVVAAQMKRLDSGPSVFNDRLVGQMLQKAFDDNDSIRSIKRRLEKHGFVILATPPELTAIRRDLVGKTWKVIANERAAGLEPGAATVCFDIRRKKEQ